MIIQLEEHSQVTVCVPRRGVAAGRREEASFREMVSAVKELASSVCTVSDEFTEQILVDCPLKLALLLCVVPPHAPPVTRFATTSLSSHLRN